jgi:hypothetical protein
VSTLLSRNRGYVWTYKDHGISVDVKRPTEEVGAHVSYYAIITLKALRHRRKLYSIDCLIVTIVHESGSVRRQAPSLFLGDVPKFPVLSCIYSNIDGLSPEWREQIGSFL